MSPLPLLCLPRPYLRAPSPCALAASVIVTKGTDLMVRNTGGLSQRRVFAPIASAPRRGQSVRLIDCPRQDPRSIGAK
eukprot:4850984-Prymnesium_polylepis.1